MVLYVVWGHTKAVIGKSLMTRTLPDKYSGTKLTIHSQHFVISDDGTEFCHVGIALSYLIYLECKYMNFLDYIPENRPFWVSDEAGDEVVLEGLGDADGVEMADV